MKKSILFVARGKFLNLMFIISLIINIFTLYFIGASGNNTLLLYLLVIVTFLRLSFINLNDKLTLLIGLTFDWLNTIIPFLLVLCCFTVGEQV